MLRYQDGSTRNKEMIKLRKWFGVGVGDERKIDVSDTNVATSIIVTDFQLVLRKV